MRRVIIFFLTGVISLTIYGQVGVGTTSPHNSAQLDVTSTNRGFLPPRMTTAQRNAIVNPAPGLMIFNTTTNSLEIFAGMGWGTITFPAAYINRLLGGNGVENPRRMLLTNDGGYILAGSSTSSANGDVTGTNHGNSDFWVVKIDAGGNISWNKLLGGNGHESLFSLQQTSGGGCIVAGYSTSSANGDVSGMNHGGEDMWIVKLDGSGNIVWNKLFGGSVTDWAQSVQETADGGYIVVGWTRSSASGDVTATNNGGADGWILKLDSSGNIEWNKLIGGSAEDTPTSIEQTSDGGYFVIGSSTSSASGDITDTNHGNYDCWIMKLDGSGNILWNKLLGGSALDGGSHFQQLTDGGYIVCGRSMSSANGNVTEINHGADDVWVFKLDAAGNIVWNKLFGGSNTDYPTHIQQTSNKGYIIAGYTLSSANGNVTGTNHGIYDCWILKLDVSGNIVWNKLLGGAASDQAFSIKETPDGTYVVLCLTYSSASGDVTEVSHGQSDYWIFKLDRLGNQF